MLPDRVLRLSHPAALHGGGGRLVGPEGGSGGFGTWGLEV